MSVHVDEGLSVARVPQQLHGVRDDGLVLVEVSLATGRIHCITEPLETRNRIVLDDLVDVRQLETVVQIRSQQCKQYLISSITDRGHAPRSRHDVVLFGLSGQERSEIVARQTDVLEHGLHVAQDLLRRHRPSRLSASGKCSFHTLFNGRISSHLFPLAFPHCMNMSMPRCW